MHCFGIGTAAGPPALSTIGELATISGSKLVRKKFAFMLESLRSWWKMFGLRKVNEQ